MHVFRDNNGRDWCVEINVSSVKRTRALLGIDLTTLIDDKFGGLTKLFGNYCDLIDVIYCLCKEEADKRGISDENFGRAMGGDSLQRAMEAFRDELTDFFPNARVRAALQKVWETSQSLKEIVMDQLERKMETIDLNAEAQQLIDSSGTRPASSVSIPAHSRSGNSS